MKSVHRGSSGRARDAKEPSPAGFEQYFAELVALGGSTKAERATLIALGQRYGLEVDATSIPELTKRFGLRFPGDPT